MSKFWTLGISAGFLLDLTVLGTFHIFSHDINGAPEVSLILSSSTGRPSRLEGLNVMQSLPVDSFRAPGERNFFARKSPVMMKRPLRRSANHYNPVAADRSWERFGDYKLTSALKRLQFAEHMSDYKLYSFSKAQKANSPKLDQFYKNNFET